MDPIRRLSPMFRPYLGALVAAFAALAVAMALQIVGPWWVGQAFDQGLASGEPRVLWGYAGGFGLIAAGQMAAQYVSRLLSERVSQAAMADLRERLFAHLVGLDVGWHDDHPSGRLISRVQGDTQALQVLFSEVALTLPGDVVLGVGMLGLLAWKSPPLALIVGATLPVWGAVLLVFRRVTPPLFIAQRESRARLTGFLAEHLRAMPMLRRYGRQDWVRARADAASEDARDREIAEGTASVALFNALFAVRTAGFAAVLWGGGHLVAREQLTVGALVMALGYLRQLFAPLMRLSHNLATVERARASAGRVVALLDTIPAICAPEAPVAWPSGGGSLRLEGVSFRYRADAPVVLDGIDLDIPAGRRVGVVGVTGSGKSTLLALLLRFRDPIAGRVSVGGVDLRAMDPEALRARIGYVAQDVRLFEGTVAENVAAPADIARRALEEVGLGLDLDAPISRDGANLSRGERQLLSLARALARDPTVIVLDEATSAVDPETEAHVQSVLDRVFAGRTAVIVAHRLQTVRSCDEIVVLAGGRLVARGPHDLLVAQGGLYATLWAQQQGAA